MRTKVDELIRRADLGQSSVIPRMWERVCIRFLLWTMMLGLKVP